MRKKNEELVLRLLRRHGPLSRSELIAMSGLSRTTLYDIVVALVDDGTLTVSVPEVARRGRGRPVEKLALNPAAGQVVGIDFAQHAVRVAIACITQESIGTLGEQHEPGMPWQDRVETAYRLVGTLAGGTPQLGGPSEIGIGVNCPVAASRTGRPDPEDHGTVAALVRERFGAPVRWESSTRLAALAESKWGAAAGERDVLYLQLSYRVGGGLVVDGTLHRGANGRAGEFGHITVDPDGPECGCGGSGCLETVAAVGAVLDSYRAAGGAARDLPELVTALDAGDRRARAVLAGAGARIGRALALLAGTVDPRVVVVGGELAEVGPAVMEPIAREAGLAPVPGARMPTLRTAKLGGMSSALGAVTLLRPGAEGVPRLAPPAGEGRYPGRRPPVPLRHPVSRPASRHACPAVPDATDARPRTAGRASGDVGRYSRTAPAAGQPLPVWERPAEIV
ncbi:ROK family transcriptional regulator [Streptomyces olivochromogenes]|uniref:ROK family transcriptional regulator n=1 Tax=Streptomyces olivochromogenes TaxID=1963 RepID=UPI001F3B37E0|nr:ROK family transcriptional regulator [Streptomyces olivochromogenes]MCF3129223.1 ROK family transcriptional regulator [Streptomyces olivochromogenes]